MAQDSKRLRRNRKARQSARRYVLLMERDNRHVNQEMKQVRQQLFNTNLILLSVLSQQGGEVTVTQGTFQQVVEQGPRLGWQSGLGPTVEGQAPEFIVRVVVQESANAPHGITTEPSDALQSIKSTIQDTVPSSEDTPVEDSIDGAPI